MKLHKPKRVVWNTALIVFIGGIILGLTPLPIPTFFVGWAFWLVVASAALLLLGTSLF
jgi:hypothetical protein